jgi:hypothetical protein
MSYDVNDQLPIRFSAFFKHRRKNMSTEGQVHQLFTDLKKSDSLRKEVIHNILNEAGDKN